MDTDFPKWLQWAREIQALSQTGLAFAETDYEISRYKRLIEIASEITEESTQLSAEDLSRILMYQPGYATPKCDVRAAVVKENEILLVKETTDGRWAMPGGWADVGDTPSEAAVRETFEESGFDVEPIKVVGVFDANRSGRPLEFFHAFKVVFLCKLLGGKAKTSDETSEVKFWSFYDLPELSTNRTNIKHIEEIQKHLLDMNRPAYFD